MTMLNSDSIRITIKRITIFRTLPLHKYSIKTNDMNDVYVLFKDWLFVIAFRSISAVSYIICCKLLSFFVSFDVDGKRYGCSYEFKI